ncbi:MAG: EamA family transporter [Flavobacterium sp. BFFFF2]|nr:MAG: EamA family transporter [Flavobacterium sp. BFFFF2]
MFGNRTLKGVFLVALGASSYGMLATFVKLAYQQNYTTAEVTTSQFVIGIIIMLCINGIQGIRKKQAVVKATTRNIFQLMLAGTSLGMTSVFYYLAVKYIPVSIGIVLLMQTVWMGVLLEWILDKQAPSKLKLMAVGIVVIGTALATNSLNSDVHWDWRGVAWGLLAASSFTATMFTANRIALGVSSAQRSLYMLLGGAIIVFGFSLYTQTRPFQYDIFYTWGLFIAIFGTVIPPILMNAGFPLTGIGLGSIVSSLELPVSVMMAFMLLHEEVLLVQWIGIALILGAIVLMNWNMNKKAD